MESKSRALEEERRRREELEKRLQEETTRRQKLIEREVKLREKQRVQVSAVIRHASLLLVLIFRVRDSTNALQFYNYKITILSLISHPHAATNT